MSSYLSRHKCEPKLDKNLRPCIKIERVPDELLTKDDLEIFQCSICSKQNYGLENWKKHILTHSSNETVAPNKVILKQSPVNINRLISTLPDDCCGILLYHEDSQLKYQCIKCLKSFGRKYSFAFHSVNCKDLISPCEYVSPKEVRFYCSNCYTFTSSIVDLVSHRKDCANDVTLSYTQTLCNICGHTSKYFNSAESFHVSHNCGDIYNYMMSASVKVSPLPDELFTREESDIFACKLCPKTVFKREDIDRHQRTKHAYRDPDVFPEPNFDTLHFFSKAG